MKKTALVILSLGVTGWVNAQSITPDVVASAGTHFSNGTAQLSWTIGEPVIKTYDNGSNILTQGFHQPSLSVTGIHESEMVLEGISVFPNPSTYELNIRLENQFDDISMVLFDAAGRVVNAGTIVSGSTAHQLNLAGVANGSYLLRLTTNNGQQIFNIQKVQP